MPTQPCTQCFFPNAERLIGEESPEALGTRLMPTKTMVRLSVKLRQQRVNAFTFYTSKEGLGYKGNSAISLRKKTDTNLWARLCSGHYAFHNSVSRTRLPLPILNSRLLYQAS